MRMTPAFSTSIYELLTNEEDARACTDIADEACRATPRNFALMLLAYFLTKLGDAIANPKTVLPWILANANAPAALIGFLVPVRESGSLIPQLLIAGWVRKHPVRKWIWVIGAVGQALAVIGMGLVALGLTGAVAGWAVIGLLVVFSLARGLCSVASKDVLGKTVPKGRRGQLTGWSASAAGLVTLGVGAMLLLPGTNSQEPAFLGVFIACAGILWLAAAGIYALIKEFPGETAGGKNAITEALERLRILADDTPFRRFVISRSLLLCSALSAPFYVLLARESSGSASSILGLLVISTGLASLLSAPLWGRFADRSSRRVMIIAGGASAGIGLLVFLADRFLPALLATSAFIPLAYFALSVAHGGVRVGRKTYVVDLAAGNRRTDYVAVSNTIIGIVLLLAGATGALTTVIDTGGVILVLSLMGLAGSVLASRLPELR